MLRPKGDEVSHAVEHGEGLAVGQRQGGRGLIHRLHPCQAAAIAGLAVDQGQEILKILDDGTKKKVVIYPMAESQVLDNSREFYD